MTNFIVLTLSIAVALLLVYGAAFVVMLNPKVMKWYCKKTMKMMEDVEDELLYGDKDL